MKTINGAKGQGRKKNCRSVSAGGGRWRRRTLLMFLFVLPLLLGAKPKCQDILPPWCFGQRWEVCLAFWFPPPVPEQPINLQCGGEPCREGTCSGSTFFPVQGTGTYWCLRDNGPGIPDECIRCAGSVQTIVYGAAAETRPEGEFRILNCSLDGPSYLAPPQSITFTFSNEIDPASVQITGAAVDQNVPVLWFGETTIPGDTLTLLPQSRWDEGFSQTLNLELKDVDGRTTTIARVINVRDLEAELDRARTAILQRRAELAGFGWNNPEGDIVRIGNTPSFVQHFPAVTAVYNPFVSGGRGSMYYSPGVGAVIVYGSINAYYQSLGAQSSALGLPVTDELPDGFGRVHFFTGGRIHWNGFGTWHVLN